MSFNPYAKLTGGIPAYPWGTYGIEVEAERLPMGELNRVIEHLPLQHPRLQALAPYWNVTTDGSLRHNGVEWITNPINYATAEVALHLLYEAMRDGLFSSSVRAGIHVHVNMAPVPSDDFVQAMRAYALLEPLLFRYVGVEREQNIYCVPLYRASNEQRLWQTVARLMHGGVPNRHAHSQLYGTIRECCKYSALNISPFIRLGTFEYRHAPTFESRTGAVNWLRLVQEVSEFRVAGDATLESLAPARAWAAVLVPNLDWDEYLREVQERGLLGFANSLQPFTYKVAEWGKPAGLAFDRVPLPESRQAHARVRLRPMPDSILREMADVDVDAAMERVFGRPEVTWAEPEPEELEELLDDHDDEEVL